MIVNAGFSHSDYIYYVKEEGIGLAGVELLDSDKNAAVMLIKYDNAKIVNLTIIKRLAEYLFNVPSSYPNTRD